MKKRAIYKVLIKKSRYLVFFVIFSCFINILVVRCTEILAQIVDNLSDLNYQYLQEACLNILLMIMIVMLFSFLKTFFGQRFSISIQRVSRDYIADKLYRIQYPYFENHKSEIVNIITSDLMIVAEMLSENLPELCTNIITIVIIGISIFRLQYKLLLGIILCYPIILYVTNKIANHLVRLAKTRRGKFDHLTEVFTDCLSGIDIVRSFQLLDIMKKRVEHVIDDILLNEASRNKYNSLSGALNILLKWVPSVICSVISLYIAMNGDISVGQMMAFVVLLNKMIIPMSELPFQINDLRESGVSLKRVEQLMEEAEEDDIEKIEYRTFEDEKKYNNNIIRLENIGFSYDGYQNILKNCNINFQKNKITAIVGPSGEGKSTILKIICGFVTPTQGCYRILGQESRQLGLKNLRNQIALVSQNVYLFQGTIRENIACGNVNMTDEEIYESCKIANIHEAIMSLPDQYDSVVGERGAMLSGGERQRISIARAIAKHAKILLMDEPTAAIDGETEKQIQSAIESVSKNMTVIIVAHRLSTIVYADQISVIKDGRVIEQGKHEELVYMNGVYAGLFANQDRGTHK